jgi:hypothetical protein
MVTLITTFLVIFFSHLSPVCLSQISSHFATDCFFFFFVLSIIFSPGKHDTFGEASHRKLIDKAILPV